MSAIISPSLWLPPSMRPRSKKRWLDHALDFRRWKRRLLDALTPIGVAADGDTMLDPNGDLVLDTAGDVELQDSTGCSACCPGCATCWTNDAVPSINVAISGYNYPTDWVCYNQACSSDPFYGDPCDPCLVGRFNYDSGSIDTTFNVPASSVPACPGFGGGPPTGGGGHWRGCFPSPVTYLFCRAFDTIQLISPLYLLIDLTCCCTTGGCQVGFQIFMVGCVCDVTGTDTITMLVMFDGGGGGSAGFLSSMSDSFTLDNEIASADAAFGGPLCEDNIAGGWGGTVTISKGT